MDGTVYVGMPSGDEKELVRVLLPVVFVGILILSLWVDDGINHVICGIIVVYFWIVCVWIWTGE